jgi:hypothetical protein
MEDKHMEKKSIFEVVSEIQEAVKPLGLEITAFNNSPEPVIQPLSPETEPRCFVLKMKEA